MCIQVFPTQTASYNRWFLGNVNSTARAHSTHNPAVGIPHRIANTRAPLIPQQILKELGGPSKLYNDLLKVLRKLRKIVYVYILMEWWEYRASYTPIEYRIRCVVIMFMDSAARQCGYMWEQKLRCEALAKWKKLSRRRRRRRRRFGDTA